jgi:hypothetical protein
LDLLVGAKDLGLLEHGIDEGGLAMVDVGNNGNVADVGAGDQVVNGGELLVEVGRRKRKCTSVSEGLRLGGKESSGGARERRLGRNPASSKQSQVVSVDNHRHHRTRHKHNNTAMHTLELVYSIKPILTHHHP